MQGRAPRRGPVSRRRRCGGSRGATTVAISPAVGPSLNGVGGPDRRRNRTTSGAYLLYYQGEGDCLHGVEHGVLWGRSRGTRTPGRQIWGFGSFPFLRRGWRRNMQEARARKKKTGHERDAVRARQKKKGNRAECRGRYPGARACRGGKVDKNNDSWWMMRPRCIGPVADAREGVGRWCKAGATHQK